MIDKAHGGLLKNVIDNPTSYYHDNFMYGDYDDNPMMRLVLPDPTRGIKRTSTEGCKTPDGCILTTRTISQMKKIDDNSGYHPPKDRPFEPAEYIARDYLLCCYQASDWEFVPGWSGESRAHEIQVEMALIDPAILASYRLSTIHQHEQHLRLKPGLAHGHRIRPRCLAPFKIPPDFDPRSNLLKTPKPTLIHILTAAPPSTNFPSMKPCSTTTANNSLSIYRRT